MKVFKRLRSRTVYFYRDYHRFQGGHLKVFHYFSHFLSFKNYHPRIFFTDNSVWTEDNPWRNWQDYRLGRWGPETADMLFLAGLDWLALPADMRRGWPEPVINLIQHVRHGDPGCPLYDFLSNRAIRICVSPEVTDALRATHRVNGPLFTIPNGMDIGALPPAAAPQQRRNRLVIAGLKRPDLARILAVTLNVAGWEIECQTELISRPEFLKLMGAAEIVLLLPDDREGFYLPALEAMAMGCLVICPDCVGNRSFCIDGQNCVCPDYTVEGLAAAIQIVLQMNEEQRRIITDRARRTVMNYSIDAERCAFLEIVNNASALYHQKDNR